MASLNSWRDMQFCSRKEWRFRSWKESSNNTYVAIDTVSNQKTLTGFSVPDNSLLKHKHFIQTKTKHGREEAEFPLGKVECYVHENF
jgi:hypothetical protein